ncbi:MAG: hypothetical protein GF398_00750 [Chitinivibrionales bacterium]|nr:hypothetical protein [Chitinivibrionales bacterium]
MRFLIKVRFVKISEILAKNAILLNLNASTKEDALNQMAQYCSSLYDIKPAEQIKSKVLEREAEMSTGIGFGIAIPHARIDGLDKLYMVAATVSQGIDFEAMDDEPVHLLFLLLSPTNTATDHAETLSALSAMLAHVEMRSQLLNAPDEDAFLKTITNGEDKYVR